MECTQVMGACKSALLICLSLAALDTSAIDPTAQVFSIIKREVTDPNTAWPPQWQRDYLDTIRDILSQHQDRPDYNTRLEIVQRAFASFCARIRKANCTEAQFSIYKAEIRWFLETLMSEALPTEADKSALKAQFQMLCDYATEHLQEQFPFLEEASVQQAKKLALTEFDTDLAAPLVPIFRRPLSENHLNTIKVNWARSHLRWFFIWRHAQKKMIGQEHSTDPADLTRHPHGWFVRRCLGDVPSMMWISLEPPGYARDAYDRLNTERNTASQDYARIHQWEISLNSRRANHLEQVEHWAFVFTSLLETTGIRQNHAPPAQERILRR